MTAVSQSYPNYLGGLNEQPDELKKAGQLSEALNVVPDPVRGLTRRPGFELVKWTNLSGNNSNSGFSMDPSGTWFQVDRPNLVNSDYVYYGCANQDGNVNIFNQDGQKQKILYARESLLPHKSYVFEGGFIYTYDENNLQIGEPIKVETPQDPDVSPGIIDYFRNTPENPLKYCVSKDHVIFSNPTKIPDWAGYNRPDASDKKKYYSFINLKIVDTENYNYSFKRFYADDNVDTYRYITEIEIDELDDIGSEDYDRDTSLFLQTGGPYRFTVDDDDVSGVDEPAIIEVDFRGQITQVKSDGGDGYYNKVTYTHTTEIISAGKGFRNTSFTKELSFPDKEDLKIKFKITDTQKVTATKNVTIIPEDISNSNSAEDILNSLRVKFEDAGIDKAVVTGSGLYLENNVEFSVSTAETAIADIINSEKMEDDQVPIARVNTVAELPVECYAGFIVEVVNSFDNKNNYYLKFASESESTPDVELTKSDGFWEEVAKPYEPFNPDPVSLPHMITIVRNPNKDTFLWVISPIEWEARTAGTSNDNPSMFEDKAAVTELNYYKNRLFMMTRKGTIISSRAGEINNLFINTAISSSVIDPVDIIANSNQRVPIYGSAIVNNSMVLFGETEQYSMTTNGDILSTETVGVTKISNYTFDKKSQPIYLGTNLGFTSSGQSRLYEMTNVYDRGPIDINERSQQIQTQFGKGFNMPVSSREQSMVLCYKSFVNTTDNSKDIYMYRFRQESSQESSQTSWVKWRLPHPVAFVSLPSDKIFVVVADENNVCRLYRMDSTTLSGMASPSLTNVPTFLDGYNADTEGVPFETRITFPTIYPRGKDSYDITSNVTVHRLKLSTSAVGAYNLSIKRVGYDPYEILVEQAPSDDYDSNEEPLESEHIETVPTYTRNKNLTITMSTSYNAPLTLRSMAWEGDWNPPYYKRV